MTISRESPPLRQPASGTAKAGGGFTRWPCSKRRHVDYRSLGPDPTLLPRSHSETDLRMFGGPRRLASGRRAGLQIKFRPQINLPRIRIIDQQLGLAFADHFAVMDQISAIDQLQRFPDVVIGDEDAEAALLEAADDFLHFINRDRIDAAKRLVE